MSLQVWLPLNGDLRNQGVAEWNPTGSNIAYTTSGKIGKALTTGSVVMPANVTGKILNNNSFSYCCWIYVNAETGSTNRSMIFGNNSGRRYSIFQYPSCNDLHLSWINNAEINTFIGRVDYGVLPSYKWTHIAVTYDNPICKVYINGKLISTSSGVSNNNDFNCDTTLIHDSSYRYLNDVRIYDNTLSEKEVKEIAKGLVLHYPLNDISCTRSANKYSGEYFNGGASAKSPIFTQTKLTNENGYNYSFSYTGNGSNNWISIGFPVFSFTPGKTYDWSCKVRVNSCSNAIFSMRTARMENDWEKEKVIVVNSSLIGKGWIEYHARETLQETSVRNGTTYTTNPIMEYYSRSMSENGTVYSANFDIKDVMVCEVNGDAPINNGSYATSNIYDTSGFSNNGTISTNRPSFDTDSPRYDGCYKFDGTSYIKSNFTNNMNKLSFSFWVKPNSSSGDYCAIATNYADPTGGGFWIATNCEGSGLWFYCHGYVRGSTTLTDNVWYHACFVFDNGNAKWYLNGNQVGSTTTLSSTSLPLSNLTVGNSYRGTTWNTKNYENISDVRLYATALSAEDIKELYNSPIHITNSGTLMCGGEVIE